MPRPPPPPKRAATGVLRPNDEVPSQHHGAADDLARFVERTWTARWDRRGHAPWTSEIVSDPNLHLSFLREDHAAGGGREHWFTGVSRARFAITLTGRGHVRGVKLRPGGHLAFFDAPASAFVSQRLPMHTLWPAVQAAGDTIVDDDAEADDELAFARVDALLRTKLRGRSDQKKAHALIERAERAFAVIQNDPTVTSVEALVERVGERKRELQRLFEVTVGLGPKWAIQRARLQEAALSLQQDPQRSLVELAHELGYFDQPHFARHFKQIVGVAPKAFARAEQQRRQAASTART